MNLTYAPLNHYFAAYLDPVKSLPHIVDGRLENPRGLGFWIPGQRYIANMQDYLGLIANLEMTEHVVTDPNDGEILLKFFVANGRTARWTGEVGDGMIALQYILPKVVSLRKREDGLLGIETVEQLIDTRLSVAEKLQKPELFPGNEPTTTSDVANFSSDLFTKAQEVDTEEDTEASESTQ